MTPSLPANPQLNVGALSRLFKNVSASYKFLWMLGILKALENGNASGRIETWEIVRFMLQEADAPIARYHLSFGASDKINEYVCQMRKVDMQFDRQRSWGTTVVDNTHTEELKQISKELLKYVPHLLIEPFFTKDEFRNCAVNNKRDKIHYLANKHFNSNQPPLYRLEQKPRPTYIELPTRWLEYLTINGSVIKGWVLFHWVEYLQGRNPCTPSIINKIVHPEMRMQMTRERAWWKNIIVHDGNFKCIYTDKVLQIGKHFDLDHYIPWTFIGHNRLWNLIPVSREANRSKSDSLPATRYLDRFIKTQHSALCINAAISASKNKKLTDAYVDDLKVPIFPAPDYDSLEQAYKRIIPPMITLAQNQGHPKWGEDHIR